MRCVAYLETSEAAETIRDFLYVEGIPAHVEHEEGQGYALWVEDEDQLALAGEWVGKFQANPRDPVFKSKAKDAQTLRQQAEKSDAAYARKLKDRRQVFRPMVFAGAGPWTIALIVVCVLLALVRIAPVGYFLTQEYLSFSLPEILHGQVWRLLTPIFMHAPLFVSFGFLHVLFNCLWLRDLGGTVEIRQGSLQLLLLVVGLGIFSNAVQYFGGTWLLQLAGSGIPPAPAQLLRLFAESLGGQNFYGMSGVNFGLVGYIWMRGRFDPGGGLFLHPQTVGLMLIWLVLGFTPLLGNMANGAHLGGLLGGMAWGVLASLRYR